MARFGIGSLNPFEQGLKEYYFDAEELTDAKSAALAVTNRKNIRDRLNIFEGVTQYQGIVISEVRLLTSLGLPNLATGDGQDNIQTTRFVMKVHIPLVHDTIGNPCDVGELKQLSLDEQKQLAINRIKNHPWFIGKARAEFNNNIPAFGSRVLVEFKKGPNSGRMIDGVFLHTIEESRTNSINDFCSTNLSGLFQNKIDGLTTVGSLAPVQASSGTSPTSTFVGNKDDPSFAQCKPSYYQNLEKKQTTFSTYEKASVVEIIKKVQPDKNWQKIMWCYIRQEQGFTYPNNNVAGINIDSGNFGPESQFDYQTCYRDAQRFRVFAGFNSLERGMKVFSDIVYNRRSKYKLPGEGSIQDQAEKIAYNYFSWWTILATPEQIELLKKQGYFILSNGTKVEKNYNKTYSNFVSFLNEYQKLF